MQNLGDFNITGGGTMQDGGGGLDEFINLAGLTVNPGGGNTVTMHVQFENSAGICDIQSGSLFIDGGSILDGEIKVPQFSAFILAATDPRIDQLHGAVITGQGITSFKSHITVSLLSTIETDVYDQSTTLDGDGTLESSGTYTWYGKGQWLGTGQMKILAGKLLLPGNPQKAYFLTRTIDNSATVTWTGGDISVSGGANIINENQATFHIQTDNNILKVGGSAGSFQNNSGAVLVKDGGTATTRIDLVFFPYNGGTIKVTAQGARIKFTPFMLNFGGLSITVTSAGMDFSAGLEQDSGSTSIVANTATITVAGGNMVVKGGTVSASGNTATGIFVTGQYQQSGGTSTPGAYSTFSATDQIVESGGTIELQGGTL
jgi:hypothetical protein